MTQIFGEDLVTSSSLSASQKKQFVLSMLTVVFAHRHNKKDSYITETADQMVEICSGIDPSEQPYFDFSIMRNVMYQYSKKAQ